jgi:protein-disulfide isomerase
VCLLLCAVGCAQSNAPTVAPDVTERIQRQVRAFFNIPPDVDIKVGALSPSEFPGYDTVNITMSRQGKLQKADFLLSKDGKSLFRLTKIDLTKDIYAETMGKITVAERPARGNPNAKVTVVNFDDFECPFCARMHTTLMSEILPEYGDKVKIIYKDYPLAQMHPWAQHAAIDANCLAKESGPAYWQLADYLHANQRGISGSQQNAKASEIELDRLTMDFGKKNGADASRLQACINSQADAAVKASVAEGDTLGVSATPTVFINGERLEGALDADSVRAALNRQLLAAGVQPPPPKPAPVPAAGKPAANSVPPAPAPSPNAAGATGGSAAAPSPPPAAK